MRGALVADRLVKPRDTSDTFENSADSICTRGDRPPKIVFTLHELGQGGTDRVCAHLAQGFAAAGFAVEVIVLFGSAPSADAMLALMGDRVSLRVLNQGRGSRHFGRLTILPRLIAGLRASAADVVMSTGNNMNWATALAFQLARLGSARLVLKITNPVIRPKDGLLRRLYRRARYRHAFGQASAVLTLCDHEAAMLATAFPTAAPRIQTIINPYVTADMLMPRSGPESVRDIVVAIGRLVPQKQFDLLIRAIAQVRPQAPQLVILGEGPERRSLEMLTREMGLGDLVTMPGYMPDIVPWLRRARLLVLSSRYEGLPAVVLEAMAAECPVVTTDCFMSATTLVGATEGCAMVAEPTPATIARAIESCLAAARTSNLSKVAERYSVANGVKSHVNAVLALDSLCRSQTANEGMHAGH